MRKGVGLIVGNEDTPGQAKAASSKGTRKLCYVERISSKVVLTR